MVYSSFKEKIAIAYATEAQLPKATELAKHLNLPINNQSPKKLLVTEEQLLLVFEGMGPLSPDFSFDTWKERRQAGKKQGLVRACKPQEGLHILDATAGWGRDAAILASFGARVTLLEKNPIMAALLNDALSRYELSSDQSQQELKGCKLKLDLHSINAFDYLPKLSVADYPDVIYIDPMHPKRQKTALVKKNMQVLQQLLENEKEEERSEVVALLRLAIQKSKKKVVLKWPQQLPPIAPPQMSISERTIRFDIYLSAVKK